MGCGLGPQALAGSIHAAALTTSKIGSSPIPDTSLPTHSLRQREFLQLQLFLEAEEERPLGRLLGRRADPPATAAADDAALPDAAPPPASCCAAAAAAAMCCGTPGKKKGCPGMPGRGTASAAKAAGEAPKGSMPSPAWFIAASAGWMASGGRVPGVLPGVPAGGSMAASAAACCAATGGALAAAPTAAAIAACACCCPSVGLEAASIDGERYE